MLLDMALGSEAPTSFQHRCRVTAALLLIVCVTLTKSAPTTYDEVESRQTDLAEYFNNPNGCYYNYQHYEEGDRIVTNEPCLNCTCHNRMLMCYLRVCPFSKAIGQDCTVQKTPDQCCPTISCPEVPVHLLTSSTTQPTTTTTKTTTIGWHDNYGCMMDENGFFPDGAQVPIDPKKPCELCYCIRNRTACVIQECTLHVEGCRPVYQDGVCCPVRYDCDYEIEKSTTTTPQISGGLVFSTTSAPSDCRVNDEVYTDGESIAMNSEKPCQHCYCMRGDIVCVVQDCGEPLRGKDCTPETPPAGQCCPTSYQCANETMDSYSITTLQPASQSDTDEHEAEKFPSNDDVYNKLGENRPESQQEDTNDIESDQANTTPITDNEIQPIGMSDQTDDSQDSVPDSPVVAEATTNLPASDGTNKINEENKEEISSAKPDSPNQLNPVSTESDSTKLASTDKPVDSTLLDVAQQTQSPSADPSSVNENVASFTTQATSDGTENGENGNNDSSNENPSQDDLSSNSPVVTTENVVESETHNSNLQDDKSQEGIQLQTDAPSIIEKEPTKSSHDKPTPDQHSESTPHSEITSNKIEDPPKTSDVGNTESNVEENKIQTSAPLSEDVEQTTQQITQNEPVKTSLSGINAQTDAPASIIQDSLDQSNQLTTQTPQDDISVTDSSSIIEPNAQNNDNSQEENVSPTEIPKVDNEPTEENKLTEENKPQAENRPESENASTVPNQDSPLVENTPQTEVPNIENESTEQNKLQDENKPAQTGNQPESGKIPAEQNQGSTQGENLSPTEIPKVENQNKLQEGIVSSTGSSAVENQDNTQEGSVSPTDVPKVENEPTEQNKPQVEDNSQIGNRPESDSVVTKPHNQDNSQTEHEYLTEIPNVGNEPTEQNKPLVEDDSQTENQPELDSTATESNNQGNSQSEKESSTEIPKIINEPNEQNKPLVEDNSQTVNQPELDSTATESNNQGNSQSENESSTEIPKIVNEPNEQNKPLVESVTGTENKPESENKPTEQNQDSPQVENTPSTDIPKVENESTEQNKPLADVVTEQNNQDTPQSVNVSPTDIPKVENEPTEQNKPTEEDKPQNENQPESEISSTENINQDSPQLENESSTEVTKVENEPTEQNKISADSTNNNGPIEGNQPESDKISVKPSNQNSAQIENVSPTDTPKVENEPVEQNKPTEVNSSQSENQPEPQNTPAEENQNGQEIENISPTEIPKIENEPIEQNKPAIESSSQSENQPKPQNNPTEANQDGQQVENVSPTEIPKVENEPVEQNKPATESNSQTEDQSKPQNPPAEPNQDNAEVENVSPTDIPTKLSEQQPDSVSQIKPDTPINPVSDLPTEQPISIFMVTSTSRPVSSENQVKDKESTSILNENENSETEKKGDNVTEKQQQTADDKISSNGDINTNDVSSVSSTESTLENNHASSQTNDEKTEHSTETKPIENDVNVGTSDNVANNQVSSTPKTETNDDFNSELINQGVLVDDPSSQDNEPSIGEENGVSNADSDEHQTETPTETVSLTNGDSLSVNEQGNDVTTSLPQQQFVDNNIPVQPEIVNLNEPSKTQDETKKPSDLPENSQSEKFPDSQVTTEINKAQDSNEFLKPTELPTLVNNNGEQFVPTQIPVKINEDESITSHDPSLDKNVNEVLDQTTVYSEISADKNNLNVANGLDQNNQDSVTPSSVETSTNVQSSGDEPVKNVNQDVSVENESSTTSQQINQDSSDNAADSIDNSVTTTNYANVPSIIQTTNAPAIQEIDNKGSFSVGQSDKIETNTGIDQSENVKPQDSFNTGETSTQYNADDSSTNSPVHESPSVNNNVEASTNAPANPEIPNEVNQDSITESELFATVSPTEKNILVVDSNKTPTNDATMEIISNLPEPTDSQTNSNEITNENSSENPQDSDRPSITKAPDYVIDITASSSESPNNVPESINTENQVNEVTTFSIDKNNDATTQLYDNIQPGVPGEGSCLIDFVTYAHKAIVPKSNPCHEKCECLNSIVTCTSVNCPPAPPQHRNCIPLHPGNESWCCPTYMCEGGIEGMIFENHNSDGTPQLISTVVLEDKPGEENNENTSINEEIPTTYSPQVELEYNTLTPQTNKNSELISQNSIGVTEVPTGTEIPNKQIDDSVAPNSENIIPTTVTNLETIDNEKPVEHDKPVEINEPTHSNKPVENDQTSESEKPTEINEPAENEKPEDSIKPVESDQSTEDDKPIDDSEADVTTVSYTSDVQIATNRPDTSNIAEEQNVELPNTTNESQDYIAPSTEIPNKNYESTIPSLQLGDDKKQPGQNSDSVDLIAVTTYKPEDFVVDQQVDDNKTDGVNQPTANEEADTKPTAGVTYLPPSDNNPVDVTQTPTILADTRPTITENNDNGGLRPSSIDDIINSVNMVKDAVKNSLETSSKPADIDYQTTVGAVEDYQPTEVVPEVPASPLSSENPLSVELPQTTVNSADDAPELSSTETVNEKLPENPVAATESSDAVAGVTMTSSNQSPSADSEHQGVSTDLPLRVPETQDIATGPPSADVIANKPEEPTADDDNKSPEATTVQYSPSATGQDSAADAQIITSSIPSIPQSNAEQNTNAPIAVDDDNKSPEIASAQPDSPAVTAGPVFTDDVSTEVAEKPDVETPVSADAGNVPVSADANKTPVSADADKTPVSGDADKTPVSADADKTPVSADADKTPVAQAGQTTDDKRFGAQSSSSAPPPQVDHGNENDDDEEKRPQEESGDMVNIPFDTENPSAKPSPIVSSTPATALQHNTNRPSYTPIPQSTWTQKPFHQDISTSEAPQPDQGFPDEYDDENESVYGPGTCRYGGKIYVSAQQVPRDDPCDFCFCFRGDIICLQQSCPPPIFGCYQENIQGFCCPRYECPVAQATSVNVTTTTTTTTTMVPPHFFANAYRGAARRTGCLIHGHAYRVGEDVGIASGPCLECICGADGKMACDPKPCSPEPLLRKMMAEAVDQRRR